MNEELQKKLLKTQALPWGAAIGIVLVVLLINRVFEHPSLIVGPITMLLLFGCYMISRAGLQKFIDELPKDEI